MFLHPTLQNFHLKFSFFIVSDFSMRLSTAKGQTPALAFLFSLRFFLYFVLRERERERERCLHAQKEGQRERGRSWDSQAGFHTQLKPWEIMTSVKIETRKLNWLSPRGTPTLAFLLLSYMPWSTSQGTQCGDACQYIFNEWTKTKLKRTIFWITNVWFLLLVKVWYISKEDTRKICKIRTV